MSDPTFDFFGRTYLPISQPDLAIPGKSTTEQPSLILKADDIFLTADRLGNLLGANASLHTGLFCRDTRFLSRSQLQLDGTAPQLHTSHADGDEAEIQAFYPPKNATNAKPLQLHRHLILRGGLFDRLQLTNPNPVPIRLRLSWRFQADFLDLFEVRKYCDRSQRGQNLRIVRPASGLRFSYCGLDGALMESQLDFDPHAPDEILSDGDCETAVWQLTLTPYTTHTLGYRLSILTDDRPATRLAPPPSFETARQDAQQDWQTWQAHTTRIHTDNPEINRVFQRGDRDLYLLRQSFGTETVLAAGIPWFSTLFGRDSILAASQTLAVAPQIARDTAIALARYQGTQTSDWHDEDPGKIPHELRFGEMARCGEIPHTPYYGTVDATPLWLLLLADYYAWTGDLDTLKSLWDNVLAAMDWIDTQMRDRGYLYYLRRSPGGIDNQGWKDSGDCMVNRHGQQVEGALALCEVQAYVYAAKHRWSELASRWQRPDLQQRWRHQADDLKGRFNRDFWVDDLNYCALALDEAGNPLDSITSNPGLCLFSDIFETEKAQAVSDRLMQPDLFSGWGIRTLSGTSPAYDPEGYHLGSVWHHDTAAVAVGLRYAGYGDRALALAASLMDMVQSRADLRPPELFCGYPRTDDPPVAYPVACSPQAWATGSLFQMWQMSLGLQPDAEGRRLTLVDPALLPQVDRLEIRGLRVGEASLDLQVVRGEDRPHVEVLDCRGDLEVAIALK